MRVIESPSTLKYETSDIPIFLAGGITGCPDWQGELIEMLSDQDDSVILVNPRRADFPMGDPDAGRIQIKWEFDMLHICPVFSMWFCSETIQPICLYELGRYVARWELGEKPRWITIGVDPDYERKFDVEIQSELICEDLSGNVATTLESHADNIRELVASIRG